jgi:uncharacterized protein
VSERLTDILACPVCKGPLQWRLDTQEFVCRADRLAYPVRDGIPVMLADEARRLAPDDGALVGREVSGCFASSFPRGMPRPGCRANRSLSLPERR